MAVIDVVILSVVILALIISFITTYMALSNVQKVKNFATNTELQSAKNYLWMSITLSIIALLMIIALLIMSFVYKDKVYDKPYKYIIIGVSAVAWLFILIAGIAAALAANKIRNQNVSSNWAIGSAVFLLLIANLPMIGYTIYVVARRPSMLKKLKDFSVKDRAQAGINSAKRLFGLDRRKSPPVEPEPTYKFKKAWPNKGETGLTQALNETFG
jgi:hypothetical protein